MEAGVGQLVVLPEDAVALDALVLGLLDGQHAQGDAHLADEVLVALEHAPEGGVVVGVARHPLVDLGPRQRLAGFEQGGHEVDEPFQAIHRRRAYRWPCSIRPAAAVPAAAAARKNNGSWRGVRPMVVTEMPACSRKISMSAGTGT